MSGSGPGDGRRMLLTALGAAWVLAYAYGFVAFATATAEGEGVVRGLDRVGLFLGWQGVAGVIAMAIFGISRAWPRGAAVRWLGAVPLGLAALLVAAILALADWAGFG